MAEHIVVAFRMTPAGIRPGPEGTYLSRARALCARGEELGARLVAWSAAIFALAWDPPGAIEPVVTLATGIREEAQSAARAWACGVAEGQLEPLDGRGALAWGDALLAAASLARIARPGEVLIDGDVRAVRAGLLQVVGIRAATDTGRRVRGWQLDVERPWRPAEPIEVDDEEEISSSEILQIIEETAPRMERPRSASPHVLDGPARGGSAADGEGASVLDVRGLLESSSAISAVAALPALRRARADAAQRGPGERCRSSLALAVALSVAGRNDEALLEALDALARAQEDGTPGALGACRALLAKLYARTGRTEAASLIAAL